MKIIYLRTRIFIGIAFYMRSLFAVNPFCQPAVQMVIFQGDPAGEYGTAVECGDVDGDGFADIIIGAPEYGANFEPLEGKVYVVYGSALLPDTIDLNLDQVRRTTLLGEPGFDLGCSLYAGDINGDGIEDLFAGAHRAVIDELQERGAVCVLYGSAGGWPGERALFEKAPDISIFGKLAGDQLGSCISLGDMNGDGLQDILMGAPAMNRGNGTTGGVCAVLQPLGSFSPEVDLYSPLEKTVEIRGRSDQDMFGWSLASQDVNKDGRDDLFIGAYKANTKIRDEGEAYVVPGDTSLPAIVDLKLKDESDWFFGSEFPEHMGYCVVLGDFNDDGWPDYALGSQQARSGLLKLAGKIRIVWGSEEGPGVMNFYLDNPDVEIMGNIGNGQLGVAMAVGDVNGDGIDDLIAGMPVPLIPPVTEPGRICIFLGRKNWPAKIDMVSNSPDIIMAGMEPGDWFGMSLACGDVNGDGFDDIVAGAPGEIGRKVCVIYGDDSFSGIPLADRGAIPRFTELYQNFPNPFNQETCIPVHIPYSDSRGNSDPYKLQIMDIRGRVVQEWALGSLELGLHTIHWNADMSNSGTLSSGMYLCRLTGSFQQQTKKILMLK